MCVYIFFSPHKSCVNQRNFIRSRRLVRIRTRINTPKNKKRVVRKAYSANSLNSRFLKHCAVTRDKGLSALSLDFRRCLL